MRAWDSSGRTPKVFLARLSPRIFCVGSISVASHQGSSCASEAIVDETHVRSTPITLFFGKRGLCLQLLLLSIAY